ncbi:MAG TPA: hypothetical protein VJQ56_05150 [Blastocatellia bacterium]|nr:hypothetical protein [Blastocatellia bacterium]
MVARLTEAAIVTLLPVAVNTKLWIIVWRGLRPRAWDGTGHYALAQVYSQTIFPDTFGWTGGYFAGMGFPNFYPPLFYWCVALLDHTGWFSFDTSFKLVVALPVLFLPASVWWLTRHVSDGDPVTAIAAGLAAIPLMIDYRFHLVGLSYHSTFLIGLYTQPLGFVLLAAWYAAYFKARQSYPGIALSSLLLALTVLANFFNAITAAIFVAATLANDLLRRARARGQGEKNQQTALLISHIASPAIAFFLTLFWTAPVIIDYDYFVTRPHTVAPAEMISPAVCAWYAVGALGVVCWLKRPTRGMWPFLAACAVLACAIAFAAVISPRWFPLQAPRFLSTLNFLLAAPAGHAVGFVYLGAARLIEKRGKVTKVTRLRARLAPVAATAIVLVAFSFIKKPSYALAFYNRQESERINGVLGFAREHKQGRYLVEVPDFTFKAAALDSRSLNSYLGAQGNEVASVVFREASPNAVFFNPLVSAFSAFPDSFGISSMLSDDLSFIEQPLSDHINQARFVGVKYLVIVSPEIKNRLAQAPGVKVAYRSASGWTVFELDQARLARVRALEFRPALLVSGLSLKLRRRNEYDFVRLAQEQFASGWFDVLVAHSPESRLDLLPPVDRFGAVIIESYEYRDGELAFKRLREIGNNRPLILLSSEDALFHRVREAIADFPLARIVERRAEAPGEWIEGDTPRAHYDHSSIRRTWLSIREALAETRARVAGPQVAGTVGERSIEIKTAGTIEGESIPVVIDTTFSPNWRRDDKEPIYPVTPFFMLTFVDKDARIEYGRGTAAKAGLALSVLFLSAVALLFVAGRRRLQFMSER